VAPTLALLLRAKLLIGNIGGGIGALQVLAEPTIRELVDRLMETGQIHEVADSRVVWPAWFELSGTSKAAIELQQAQARNLRSNWCTVNELRAEEGKDPLPNGEGNVVLGLVKLASTASSSVSGPDAEYADSAGLWIFRRLRRKKK
jgi:hypothetical protein